MRGQQLISSIGRETMNGLVDRHPSPTQQGVQCEDIRVRNYDARPHKVELQVSDLIGQTAFDETYYLPDESTACIVNELVRGEYEVTVIVDDTKQTTAECRIDEWPEGTIKIEIGNGIVNIADSR